MEDVPFSSCGANLNAAHIRRTTLQELHGWRADRFQYVALASALHTFVSQVRRSFKGWRAVSFQRVAPAV
eukprot:7560831-Pyramimonas_sp.AAC.1